MSEPLARPTAISREMYNEFLKTCLDARLTPREGLEESIENYLRTPLRPSRDVIILTDAGEPHGEGITLGIGPLLGALSVNFQIRIMNPQHGSELFSYSDGRTEATSPFRSDARLAAIVATVSLSSLEFTLNYIQKLRGSVRSIDSIHILAAASVWPKFRPDIVGTRVWLYERRGVARMTRHACQAILQQLSGDVPAMEVRN